MLAIRPATKMSVSTPFSQKTASVNPHNNFFTPKLGFSLDLNIKNDLGRIEARNDLICNVVKTIQIMKCILQS